MPRISRKAEFLTHLRNVILFRSIEAKQRYLMNKENPIMDLEDHLIKRHYLFLKARRYLFRAHRYRRRTPFDWKDMLDPTSENFNDTEFLFLFRVSRATFWDIYEKIKDHKSLKRYGKNKGRPAWQQLMVFLYRIGREGTGGSDQAISCFFRISTGVVRTYVLNIAKAILSLKSELLRWSTDEEKAEMKERVGPGKGFHQCIGIIDGTLMYLDKRPTLDGEIYFTRKGGYAINIMVVCNDKKKILYMYGGWPGSTHDNRVWRNSRLYRDKERFFTVGEYLAADSAYSKCPIIVQCFKKDINTGFLDEKEEFFNKKLASLRIFSEHCIGILKGRFPCMKKTCGMLRNKKDMSEILAIAECCAILHNFLIDTSDNKNEIPQEWYADAKQRLVLEDDGNEDEFDGDFHLHNEEFDRRPSVFRSILSQFW